MRAGRRLSTLEGSLSPPEAVLLWLSEVHHAGSLTAYLLEQSEHPTAGPPLVAIPERVRAAVRRAHVGQPRVAIREAERRATFETVFLLALAIELEFVTAEATRIGSLRLDALRWEGRARMAEGLPDARPIAKFAGRHAWKDWRSRVLDLAADLARTDASRRAIEAIYLASSPSVGPVILAAWTELHGGVTSLLAMLASTPGGQLGRRRDTEAIERAAEEPGRADAGRLVANVRVRTSDLLGGSQLRRGPSWHDS